MTTENIQQFLVSRADTLTIEEEIDTLEYHSVGRETLPVITRRTRYVDWRIAHAPIHVVHALEAAMDSRTPIQLSQIGGADVRCLIHQMYQETDTTCLVYAMVLERTRDQSFDITDLQPVASTKEDLRFSSKRRLDL